MEWLQAALGSTPGMVALVAAALAWPFKALLTLLLKDKDENHDLHRMILDRFTEKNITIDKLRAMLDRGRRRENAYATGCELLLIAMPADPSKEQTAIIIRAKELFEITLLQSGEEDGGP